MFDRPPYINDIDSLEEDLAAYQRLHLLIMGSRASMGSPARRGILLLDVFTHPEASGVKGVIRQELLRVVCNTLNRAGYIGKREDFKMQDKFYGLLPRKNQEGGMF